MAEQNRPAAKETAPDPANSYERADPSREAGMGRLDNNKSTPAHQPDSMGKAVKNRQEPRQINAHDSNSARGNPVTQPDHSMHDEEPMGADQAPTDIHDPQHKRHPRKEGKGGTP